MKLFLLILITAFACASASATTYYLSSHQGNDDFDGKSKLLPWRNLKKIKEFSGFVDGDSILFERGSIFNGQLTITHSNIYVGAYGSGIRPIINGSIELTQWVSAGKNIWKADCQNCLTESGNLFMDGKFQPLGRYPNQGYLSISSSSDNNKQAFTDNSLQFPDDHWNDAEVVVRSSRWTLDNLPVRKFHDKTFIVSRSASYELHQKFGYFIQKHLSTLDKSGEWFFNPSKHEIFLFLDQGSNPNEHKIEVSINELGLRLQNVNEVTLEGLSFRHHAAGVYMEKCHSIRLQDISVVGSGKNGLEVTSCENVQVKNSTISSSNNNGVIWNNSDGIFSTNSILRTGLHAGRGVSGNGTYIALAISSPASGNKKVLFDNNKIDSTGYIGIDFRSRNTSIENNIISNFCMVKDDGAAIYTWRNTRGSNLIEGNTIRHGIGAPEGTVNSTESFASGIYIDDQSGDVVIRNNNVSFCATSGIFLHNAKSITLTGNTVFSNGYSFSNKEKGQLYIKLDTLGEMHGNTALYLDVSQNTWIADREDGYCIFLSAKKKQDLQKLGVFNQNKFSAVGARQAVAELFAEPGLCAAPQEFSLADWRKASGQDNKSVFSTLPAEKRISTTTQNLVSNGNLSTGSKGWIVWPDKSSLHVEKKITGRPSLKVNIPTGTEALLYHAGFPLDKDKVYRLSFTATSSTENKLEFVPLMAGSPWRALGPYTCFSVDSTPKTFTYFFKPLEHCAEARINFKSNTDFWIQDVSLYEVVDGKDIN